MRPLRPLLLPVLAGVLVGGMLLGLWALLRRGESEHLALATYVAAEQAAPRLQDYVAARLTVVECLARERAQRDGMEDEAFVRRARILERSFRGMLAINWIDADGVIRIVVPEASNQGALGRQVRLHPQAGPFFERSELTGQPSVTTSLDLFQGRRGFASYFPVRRNGQTVGYVNGVFDCHDLVQSSLRAGILDSYLVRVRDAGGLIFESPGFPGASDARAEVQARVANQIWRIEVEPTPALRAAGESRYAELLLLLAALLGFVVAALTRGFLERRRSVARLALERRKLEAQMVESNKLEAIGRLAGGVAHDFNNLLTAMIGHAQLAQQTPGLPEGVRQDLEVIVEAARRGATVTRDLLTFSRKDVVRLRSIDVSEEVKRLAPMLQHLLREDVTLALELDPEAGRVLMDPSQLERALMNLVVNAVDAQPDGGDVCIRVGPEGSEQVSVSVADVGEGMSEDVAARAFEPFFTTKQVGKGTGLGLASVYGIVRQAGGDVSIETSPGAGTTVSLLLPRTTDTMAEVAGGAGATKRNAGEELLLVEDEPAVRRLAQRVLERSGYRVAAAQNAAVALALVSEGATPTILVTDEIMPGMRGHRLAAKLRETLPELRVLVCSGHADDLVSYRELEALGAGFLQKPYTPKQLCDAIAALPVSRA